MKNSFVIFLAYISLAFIFSASAVSAAITKSQPMQEKAVVYFVESSDRAGLKQGIVDLNLHLRKEGRSPNQPIKVVIHGSGVRFFKKAGIDSELEYMLNWFQEEKIDVRICEGCLQEHGVEKDSLVVGLQLWKSGIPISPTRRN